MTSIDRLFADYKFALQEKGRADERYERARQRLQEALQAPSTPEVESNPIVSETTVPSSTYPGEHYVVTEYADRNRTCTCPGFKFRKYCRHGGRVLGPTREDGTALSVPVGNA